MLAAVAALQDTAHQQMSRTHTEKWRQWLTEEVTKLGLKVTPSVANFILIHFPLEKGKTAADADAFLTKRGLVLRALSNYRLPHALRMTIGTEEANRLVVEEEIAPHLKPGAIVSDVGSVKGAVVRDMTPYMPAAVHFVPAHPVAGTEHSGPDSGFAELFINRWCILTPPEGTDAEAIERLRAFWTALGAKVEIMTPDHHDLVLAITSHLPHLIAYTIVGTADELGHVTSSEVIKFSAGGFRDFTH